MTCDLRVFRAFSSSFKIYLEGECPIVITVEEESVEDRGEGGVPHVDQEGGQELHHGGELKVKVE